MSLTSIAEEILLRAKSIDAFTSSRNLPSPNLDLDTLTDLPLDVEDTRKKLVDSTEKLRQIANRPLGNILELVLNFTDLISLRAIYRYNLPKLVPLDGSSTFAELSRASGLSEDRTRRFLQHAMMKNMFREEPAGLVRHTALSRLLVEQPGCFDMLGNQIEEFCPAGTKVLDAMDEPGWSVEEPNQTGYNLYHQTDLPVYLELSKSPKRVRRFGSAIQWLTAGPEYDVKHFVDGFDWDALDSREGEAATVVDVGGGNGQVALAIAKATKNLQFVVQELPESGDSTEKQDAQKVEEEQENERVRFMAHDFFSPQPVSGAEVYFLRWVLHNWSDKYCLMILRNLVPALRTGSKLLLCEYVLPEAAETTWKMNRQMDMLMMTAWNSKERTEKDWRDLLAQADDRFDFIGVRWSKQSELQIIEVGFRDRE